MVKVSKGQCIRAKSRALLEIEGSLTENYGKLWDYGHEIKRANPGSTVKMDVNLMADGSNEFRRFYVCFKALRDGWISGCRKVIGLDGCFLKGVCKGELISAIGRDGDNQFYPIAWVVVDVENKENWKWFIELLIKDIGVIEGVGLTIVSDQHKGIVEASHRYWYVIPSGGNVFETRNGYEAMVVVLDARRCSCRLWDISGIPCVHSIAAIHFINKDPEDYVSKWFTKDLFKMTYENTIRQLNGSNMWTPTPYIKPNPPKERRMSGRPSIIRKRPESESQSTRVTQSGKAMTRSNCLETGHNARTCKKEKRDPPPKPVKPKEIYLSTPLLLPASIFHNNP
ncbi:hypothetical protein L6452_13232 [Arctium lappa]|uniref:Uncharacterized protein n=1 Tax=Arctium lappa TaxID=4217 RepID=A0ACB9CHM9_ARCLA|nr:hypothetical protein L6452_13232 [Arctium lappa]